MVTETFDMSFGYLFSAKIAGWNFHLGETVIDEGQFVQFIAENEGVLKVLSPRQSNDAFAIESFQSLEPFDLAEPILTALKTKSFCALKNMSSQ